MEFLSINMEAEAAEPFIFYSKLGLNTLMGGSKDYAVTIKAMETVAPAVPTPERRLAMSNLDLVIPAIDVGVFFCYDHPSSPFDSMVGILRASLSQVLATYYPFAGEVVDSAVGEPELLCNNRGVDFCVVSADVALRELALGSPDESVAGKLVPEKKAGVFCVQATELKCGSLVLACTFDHRVADAYSANMFLVAWSETATCKPLSRFPSFRRSLLTPRNPLRPHPSVNRMYVTVSSLPHPEIRQATAAGVDNPVVGRIYYITAADIALLQSATKNRATKLEAFAAHIWCAHARAARLGAKTQCCMSIIVDGRTRLGDAAMESYFGNVLLSPHGSLEAGELRQMGLTETVEEVQSWLRPTLSEEYFRGLVDWVEARRTEAVQPWIFCAEEAATGCLVSSGRRFPVAEVDFGWGRPAFGSYHFPWCGSAGYVMPMPSAKGNGDWVVYAHLQRRVVDVLEAEQPPLLRPLTADCYLALDNS